MFGAWLGAWLGLGAGAWLGPGLCTLADWCLDLCLDCRLSYACSCASHANADSIQKGCLLFARWQISDSVLQFKL